MSRLTVRGPVTAAVLLAALLVAGTGGAVAGSLVTGAQIKDGTVTGADVADGSLSVEDLGPAARRGPGAASGGKAQGLWAVSGAYPSNGATITTAITLPHPAARVIGHSDVLIALGSQPSDRCKGTEQRPTAPRGKVCVYGSVNGSVAAVRASLLPKPSRLGFGIDVQGTGQYASVEIFGSWAYTPR